MDALGFTSIVQSLQANGYPANGQPTPVDPVNFASTPNTTIVGGNMNIFVKGSDDALWQSTDGGKTFPTSLGGTLTSAPTAITRGSVIDVFARGSPDGVFQKQWTGTAWREWFNLGGQVLSGTAPAAVSPDGNTIDIYVIGADTRLYLKTWNGTKWSAWNAVAKAIK